MTAAEQPTDEDGIIAALSDYLDGSLPPAARLEIEQRINSDPAWKRVHAEMSETRTETRNALSGLHKARAPEQFTEVVTETIHKRSAGRFFGRRTFGDRVPFSALVVVAVLGLIVIAYILWSSQTGSLKMDNRQRETPGSSVDVVPKP